VRGTTPSDARKYIKWGARPFGGYGRRDIEIEVNRFQLPGDHHSRTEQYQRLGAGQSGGGDDEGRFTGVPGLVGEVLADGVVISDEVICRDSKPARVVKGDEARRGRKPHPERPESAA
jgi:hypothetical protein